MSKQLLHDANILAFLQFKCRKAMSESMAMSVFRDPRSSDSFCEGSLDCCGMQMKPDRKSRLGVEGPQSCGKYKLPGEIERRQGSFCDSTIRQRGGATSAGKVIGMEVLNTFQVLCKGDDQRMGHGNNSVFIAFALAYVYRATSEIYVFDAQGQAF